MTKGAQFWQTQRLLIPD